jgi:hypothetical protein
MRHAPALFHAQGKRTMTDDPRTDPAGRDLDREARELLEYQLLPLHDVVGQLEDGFAPTFPPRLLGRSGAPAASGGADDDAELQAAVARLRGTLHYRLRFAWAALRRRARLPR